MKETPIQRCSCCGEWRIKKKLIHRPNCPFAQWEKIHEAEEKSGSHDSHQKHRAMVADYYRKKRIGPPLSGTSPKKAKAHPNQGWRTIIEGGAVETNRKSH